MTKIRLLIILLDVILALILIILFSSNLDRDNWVWFVGGNLICLSVGIVLASDLFYKPDTVDQKFCTLLCIFTTSIGIIEIILGLCSIHYGMPIIYAIMLLVFAAAVGIILEYKMKIPE